MEIPFDIIIDTEFTNAAPGSGLASFILSEPPTFYLESSFQHPSRGAEPVRHWKKCADWTENQQATTVLKHSLVGSAVQLAYVVRHLNAQTSGSDVCLHSPGYHSHSQEPSPAILEAHPPPPAAFVKTAYHSRPQDSQLDHANLTHRRSSSLPVPRQQLVLRDESVAPPFTRPSSSVISEPDSSTYPQYPGHPAIEVSQPSLHSDTALPYYIAHSSLSSDRGTSHSFSSHDSHQRPYSTASVHSLSYEDDNTLHPLGSALPTPFGTPPPPLLTTPFSAGPASGICTVNPYDPATHAILGVPNSETHC